MENKTFSDWLLGLLTGSAASVGDVPVVQGGVTKRLPLAQADGLATLDHGGKLAQPRRVLQIVGGPGTTSAPSTTAAPGSYILPDPRPQITAVGSGKLLIIGMIRLFGDADHAYGAVAAIVFSEDGGTTWNEISPRGAAETCASGCHHTITLVAQKVVTPGTTYTLGLMMGANAGQVTASSTFRNIIALEVDY